MRTIHLNYITDDNCFFCKKKQSIINVVKEGFKECSKCPYLMGSLQGEGVECMWDDPESDFLFMSVTNPSKELLRVAKMIDSHKIKKG